MTFSDYAALYLAAAYLMLLWGNAVNLSTKEAFWSSITWPLTLLVTLVYFLWCKFLPGWRIDIEKRNGTVNARTADFRSSWGIRRPSTTDRKGFAVRCPWFEIQLWSMK